MKKDTTNISLYEIASSLKQLEEMSENDEGLVPYLDSAVMTLENKVDQVVKYRQNLLASAEIIDVEVQRLLAMKKSRERLAERLKEYTSSAMLAHNIDKIDTGLFKISFRESKTVEIPDLAELSSEYIIIKTTTQADKLKIKADIEKGIEVKGAEIVIHKNLQIR